MGDKMGLEEVVVKSGSKQSEGRIIPRNYEELTQDQKYFIDRLNRFEAPYLQEKLMSDGRFETQEGYHEAFDEFKKYVLLKKLNRKGSLAMTSPKVDEVWHQFILFTQQYNQFCEEMLGEYLHHIPKTSLLHLLKVVGKDL